MTRGKLASFVLVALACTAGAVFLIARARPSTAAPIPKAGTTELRTPVWSARRVPSLLARSVERATRERATATLATQLAAIVAPVRACVAVDGVTGTLARIDVDEALAPASTLKLLTATAAISLLGADHRFTTRAVTGTNGDLVIVGAGDPLLATPENIARAHTDARFRTVPFTPLGTLADRIVAAGVRQVSGALVVDDHLHDSLRFLPAWKPVYAQEGDVGSLGALTVDGGFSDAAGTPAADPALTTGQRLATLLAARGVTIEGGIRRGVAPANAPETAHVDSAPLSDIVGEMLTSSDNYTAEELLRDIAVHAGTVPATSDAGTRLVLHELDTLRIPTAGVVMHDGSGLAPDDRATCATLLKVIDLAATAKFAAIDKGLAIAGRTGTLVRRFGGDPLEGKLRAKTGSIAGVVGLVGVVDGPNHLHFAFVANGDFGMARGAQLQADVAAAVGSTPDLAAPHDLVPAP